jgi:ABC-2 type transport system ATP-binding protein
LGVVSGAGTRIPLAPVSGAIAEDDVSPPQDTSRSEGGGEALLDARRVSHQFGDKPVLKDVSLTIAPGEIHALLGPNGAGKTTLIRVLAGLLHPEAGSVRVAGLDPTSNSTAFRQRVGFIPSGDRSFYLRISGLENLLFFGRLHGLRRREALRRAHDALAEVGLADSARLRVGEYSHGMQKRLAVARARLSDPEVLLVDEATHDLDPEGAHRVRELIASTATRGGAVLWTTQRLDEIGGFARRATVLHRGEVRFVGTVPQLTSHAPPRRFVIDTFNGPPTSSPEPTLERALAGKAALTVVGDPHSGQYVLDLAEGVPLGSALEALGEVGVRIVSCREERSQIEEAFLLLTKDGTT